MANKCCCKPLIRLPAELCKSCAGYVRKFDVVANIGPSNFRMSNLFRNFVSQNRSFAYGVLANVISSVHNSNSSLAASTPDSFSETAIYSYMFRVASRN